MGCRRLVFALVAAAALGFVPGGVREAAALRLWVPVVLPPDFTPAPEALSSQGIAIDTLRLDSNADSILTFPLSGGDSLIVVRERREHPGPDRLVWFGRVVGDPRSSITLARVRGVVVGNVTTSTGRRYRIRYAGSGVNVFEEVDVSLFPDEAKAGTVSLTALVADPLACTTDDPAQIDVLVVYTSAALTGAGSTDAMEASIHLMAGDANQSYINSDIVPRIRIVGIEPTTYPERGNVYYDLDAIRLDDEEADMADEALTRRNALGADCVVMITEETGDKCGHSTTMVDETTAFAPWAFAVVGRECAMVQFSFAHELGHIMGAEHDWVTFDYEGGVASTLYPANHGYIYKDTSATPPFAWRTMMGETKDCLDNGIEKADCTRILLWSHPAKAHDTVFMGVSGGDEPADNHLTLDGTASTVSNFRCAQKATRADAWMRDAWIDTGAEPEPALADEPMWKSPYIWVRREPDVEQVHAHQHQNPVKDELNHVFVKIHGGTTTLTGTLELYVGNASTNLEWDDDWTHIQSVNLAALAAYDTRIVHFTWTPEERGHYCLLARWSAGGADPMTTPEGTDVEANVRGNNNIVWRNVNIIDLERSARKVAAELLVANPTDHAEIYSFSIAPAHPKATDFLRNGTIRIRLDNQFRKGWLGLPSVGAVRFGRGFERNSKSDLTISSPTGAHVEGVQIAAGTQVPLRLTFAWPRDAVIEPGSYVFDIVQTRMRPGRPKVMGGVSYEVRIPDPEDTTSEP